MSYGFVYVLGNDAMPGIYKIGMTDGAPQERLEQLSSATAVPMPFEMMFFAQVRDARRVEQELHMTFNSCRVSRSREFFRVSIRMLRDEIERYAARDLIHEIGFASAAHIERVDAARLARLSHFLNQDPDPFNWSARRGFD